MTAIEKDTTMKSAMLIKTLFISALVLLYSTASSCSSEDASTSNSASDVANLVGNGTWRISYFYDTDHEATASFAAFTFTFAANSVLSATNGTDSYLGIWSISDSNSDDDTLSDLDFIIGIDLTVNSGELNSSWEIIQKSATEIKLRDVSGGNGGTDYLTFTKI
ncbi:MAG: hypothetical protein RIT03_1686 [Bacteroidota bacterium]